MGSYTVQPKGPAVEAVDLSRIYRKGGELLHVLDGVSLAVASGEVVAITGPSGSGKSTLLYLLAGLDEPDGGRVRLAGVEWQTLKGRRRAEFRRRVCGFIPQGMTLLPQATAAEAVEIPLLLEGVDPQERELRVNEALDQVGLGKERLKLADQLSGGQQQRTAIARALVNEPLVVLADEPTASLDSATAQEVVSLLVAAAASKGSAVVLVTHDPEIARHAGRIVRLSSGQIVEEHVAGKSRERQVY